MIIVNKEICNKIRQQVLQMDLSNTWNYNGPEREISEIQRSFYSGYCREYIAMKDMNVSDEYINSIWLKEITTKGKWPWDFDWCNFKYEVKPLYTDDWKSFAHDTSYMLKPQFDYLVLVWTKVGKIMFNEDNIEGCIESIIPKIDYLANKTITPDGGIKLSSSIVKEFKFRR